jgi:hypothetical protein
MAKVLMVRLTKKSGLMEEDGGDEELMEHKAVARALAGLDKLAAEAKVTPLSKFVSEDPENVYDLVDDEDEAEELLAKLPPLKWSKPADAMPTVKKLLAAIKGAKPTTSIKDPVKVSVELKDLETILKFAEAKKATFRFYREF